MEVTNKKTLKQLKNSCGGDWGGETINAEYWKLLENLGNPDVIERFKAEYKSDYLEMDYEFETRKRALDDFVALTVNVSESLLDLIREHQGQESISLKSIIKDKKIDHLFTSKGKTKLILSPTAVRQLFSCSLDKLLEATNDIRKEIPGQMNIMMVGGFSDSKLVRRQIKANFPDIRVIEPQEAALAVLKGAVLFGHNPEMVSSRMCKYTYGIEVSRTFMKSDPPGYMIKEDGACFCGKAFYKLVGKGQEINIDYVVSSDDIEAFISNATVMSFNI